MSQDLGERERFGELPKASDAAVRRLAHEAPDTGLLTPSRRGIQCLTGGGKLGARLGNWLTPDEAKALLDAPVSGRSGARALLELRAASV